MKKSELFDIAWHLWNCVDQAHHDLTIKDLMKTATTGGLKEFIEMMLSDEGKFNMEPDEETLLNAKKIMGKGFSNT